MRGLFALLVGLVAAASVGPGAAKAESLGQILSRTGFVQEDINILVRAASGLYRTGNAEVGADTVWSNPEPGAYGLAEIFEVEDNCVRIAYRFRVGGQTETHTRTTRRCLQGNEWVLAF